MINKQNIEAWLLDHLEGQLNAAQKAELERYLLQHPEWRPEEGELPVITMGAAQMVDKTSLQRSFPPAGKVDRHRLNDFLIAKLEGDLTQEQEGDVDALITANDDVASEWKLVQLTRTFSVATHPNKQELKKGRKVIALWPRLAAAASILLLLSVGFWYMRQPSLGEQQVAQEETIPKVQKEDQPEKLNGLPIEERTVDLATIHQQTPDTDEIVEPVLLKEGETISNERSPQFAEARSQNRSQLKRLQPRLSRIRIDRSGATPIQVEVAEVGISAPPSFDEQLSVNTADVALTVPQFIAKAFRRNVLKDEEPTAEPLNAYDAIAMVDRGLAPQGEESAGIGFEREPKGRGFQLRLGQNFTVERR